MCNRSVPTLPLSRGDTKRGDTRVLLLKLPVSLFDEISALSGPRRVSEVTRGLILRGLETTR